MIKKVKKSGIIQKLLNIMNIVASNQLLQYKKTDFKAKRNVTGGRGVPLRVLVFAAYGGGTPTPLLLHFFWLQKNLYSIQEGWISSILDEIPFISNPKEMKQGEGGCLSSGVGVCNIWGGPPPRPPLFHSLWLPKTMDSIGKSWVSSISDEIPSIS